MSDGATAPPLVAVKVNGPLISGARRGLSWPEHVGRALDLLPRPVGENLLAGFGMLDGLMRPARLRQALAWASAQPRGRHGRWGLALRLLANHGRFIAQEHVVGVRDAASLHGHVHVSGKEHLALAGQRATILLGFHVGPPRSSRVLQLLGYPVTSMHELVFQPFEHSNPSRGTSWQPSVPMEHQQSAYGAVALHRARRHLAGQGWLYMLADGPPGTEAYRIPLPGGPVIIREGWLALRRLTGAPTLPLLAHRDGRRRVITIHPALPPVSADHRADAEVCCAVLADLLGSYLRQFPEQCRATLWRA